MPNWCSGRYCVRSEKKDEMELMKFYLDIVRAAGEISEDKSTENPNWTGWMGNLLIIHGITMEEIEKGEAGLSCRGTISDVSMGTVTTSAGEEPAVWFNLETAWNPYDDTMDWIMDKYDGLYYVYMAEEPGMGIYINTDTSYEVFPDKYCLDYCLRGDYDTDYYSDEEKLLRKLESICEEAELEYPGDRDVVAMANWLSDQFDILNEEDGESFLYVHEYTD